MKKALMILVAVLMLMSVSALAGPLVGLSVVPAFTSTANVYFGWQSENDWAATLSLSKLNTWNQNWTLGALWTPALWGGTANLRAGGAVIIGWHSDGSVTYDGISLFLGAEKWITSMVGVYGQLNLSSDLKVLPLVGIEINFWMPSPIKQIAPPANTTTE